MLGCSLLMNCEAVRSVVSVPAGVTVIRKLFLIKIGQKLIGNLDGPDQAELSK